MDKEYIASISYGKDSIAMLHVITDILHWPLDRIITVDVWATDTIPAELPPMVEFKEKADKIIKKRWGIDVEHRCAKKKTDGRMQTYQDGFYCKSNNIGIQGWPTVRVPWCNGLLKREAIREFNREIKNKAVQYVGIAADEGTRTERHIKKVEQGLEQLPLVEAGWTEQMCRDWCEQNGLLSPTYAIAARGGCWFCHNQRIGQLRDLRHNYPDLWALMMKWDADSPVAFHSDRRTVYDIDRRLQMEDEGYIKPGKRFKWADIEEPQMNIFQFIEGSD